jgi:hypothetical protein
MSEGMVVLMVLLLTCPVLLRILLFHGEQKLFLYLSSNLQE